MDVNNLVDSEISVNDLVDAEIRKNFAIVRKRRGRGRKARRTSQKKKLMGRKSAKKRKADNSTKEMVTRLDINLTEPLPTYEELLLDIFQTGSRHSSEKMTESGQNTDQTPHFSGTKSPPSVLTMVEDVEEPPAAIQPYEYPVNPTLGDPKIFVKQPNVPISSIPKRNKFAKWSRPASDKKKSKKHTKSESRKMKKSFTRKLKEHKPSRPTPTPFEHLDV